MTDIQSFSFVIGELIDAPTIRKKGQEAQFWIREGSFRFLVRVKGLARVDTVREWRVSDRIMVLGYLESHFDTTCHRHMASVRGVTITKVDDLEEQWWEKIGLPLVLSNVYHQMAKT